jgi:O-succinylbenzoic acid--CoA ligase
MSNYSEITLNGQFYTKKDLQKICNDTVLLKSFKEEQRHIFQFIGNWLDNNDTILALSSGSTGRPKEIRLEKRHMINSAKLTQSYFNLNQKDTALLCLPVQYIAGKMMIVRAFVAGFNLVTSKPSLHPLIDIDQKIDFMALTPQQLFHSIGDIKRLSINKIIVGGGEISQQLEEHVQQLPTEIYATYGMTETCSHVALRKVNGQDASLEYKALEGIFFEQDGRDCLVIHAPMLFQEPLVTNDIVSLSDKSLFEWIGRFDNVINTGGIKVYPEQIEKKLFFALKKKFFISSVPDPVLSERVILVLESNPLTKHEEDDLKKQLIRLLSKYELPKEIIYCERFALSESGKILRKKIMEQYVFAAKTKEG